MQRFDVRFGNRLNESLQGISTRDFLGFVRPKCQQIITIDRLARMLGMSTPLRIKFGIDPTGAEIHLGHVVPIMLLQLFARSGHSIDLVIGNFTAMIGDPTARETSRATISKDIIAKNLATYNAQIGKFIDLDTLKVNYNAKWLSTMPLSEIFAIFQQVNLSEALQREDFKKRMQNGQTVSLAEACYGVLMGIDSVVLKSQIEIGGIDQLLNFQQCRSIMRQSGMDEEVILMTPILEGTSGDGKKMSKSFGNYIAVNATPEDKFGKIMSIPDRLIGQYFRSFADINVGELVELDQFIADHPFEAKKQLATFIAALETKKIEDGEKEREAFERKFTKKEIRNEDCIELRISGQEMTLDALMASGQFRSKSELRRLFDQKAVRLCLDDKESILSANAPTSDLTNGKVKVGKRRYFRFTLGEVAQC